MPDRRGPLPWDPGAAVGMRCTVTPLPPGSPFTGLNAALALLDAADEARLGDRPLCQAQLTVEPGEPGTVLRCDLPARHHSEEHYDRASGAVWLTPGTEPRTRPPLH